MGQLEYQALCDSIRQLVKNGYTVMLFHQGFGETVVFSQLIYRYKEINQRKVCLLTKSDSRTEILNCCPDVDEVIQIPEEIYGKLSTDGALRIGCRVDNFLEMHEITGINKQDVRVEICDFLHIPHDTPMKTYRIPEIEANWEEYFDAKNLKKDKSVYIVPHALFLGNPFPKEFWERLVLRLKEEGYTPVINMPEEYVEGVPYAYFDMLVSLNLVSKCGKVIGCRTGFMDLAAAFTESDMVVIYPDDSHPSWEICKESNWKEEVTENYAEKYMEGWGLNKIFGRNDIAELVFTDIEETVERIIENLR